MLERVDKLQEEFAAAIAVNCKILKAVHDRAHKLEIELAKLQAVSEAVKTKK